MSEQHCPACGEVMTPENSKPSAYAIQGKHWPVCRDDRACFDRYLQQRRPSYRYLTGRGRQYA